ncbi:MAG: metal ABC transporter permease [Elusimicrobiota bacterium]
MFEMFTIPFMQKAFIVSLLTGGILSSLGVYVVLRRIVFVGFTISQISACGFAFGLSAGISPEACSLILTLAGIALFSMHAEERRIPSEAVIGFAYAFSSALTVLFIAKSAKAESHMLDILSGNILTVTYAQIYITTAMCIATALIHLLFYEQFMFISFDYETARTGGIKAGWWNFLFFLTLGIAVSTAMKTAGILLTFGYLVLPASISLSIVGKMSRIFLYSVLFGLVCTFIGLFLSFRLDIPSGPSIVALLCLLYGIVFIYRKFA